LGRRGKVTRISVSLFAGFVTVAALGAPAGAAATAPVPPQDFVVGGGEVGTFHEISINASSDAHGGVPSGSVSFVAEIAFPPLTFRVRFTGPVTCLGVEGKRAVIGFIPSVGPGPLKVVVVDNGSTGSPADEFSVGLGPDCSDESGVPNPASLSSGDIVVRDVPTKAQCQNGAWRNYTDATGQPFKSQGDCIAFALGAV
jgi:hypothetical protein